MDEAIKYFAVFGGLDVKIDMSRPLLELIETVILNKYRFLRNDISQLTNGDTVLHSLLTAIALSDRRTNAAFKRAKISFDNGMECVDELVKSNLIKIETSQKHLTDQNEEYEVSEKLLFTSPYLRFWFAFISPLFQGIKKGEYKEFYDTFDKRADEFTDVVFEQLCHEFIKLSFTEDKIKKLGRYWDSQDELSIIGKTQSGKKIIGSCKYTHNKIKKVN